MTNYTHLNWPILGTVRNNDARITDRVTLLGGPDGYVYALDDEPDSEPVKTDVPTERVAFAWWGPAWDFWPGDCIRCPGCEEIVEPADNDGPGFGTHCPLCDCTL